MPDTNKEKSVFNEIPKTTIKKTTITKIEKYLDNYYSTEFIIKLFA
tara:strand:- start:40 stop:177 length:138 start_codon:yes stop_codon:yes gene_type:complete